MNILVNFLVYSIVLLLTSNQAIDISQWRGPNRDGKYLEKNLLKEWPDAGPEMIWSFEGLGDGHGNVGIGVDRIFVCGMIDSVGYLFSFDFSGKLLWKKPYGPEWYKDYTGVRSTPTVVGELVYFESGQGVVYCYNGNTGKRSPIAIIYKKGAFGRHRFDIITGCIHHFYHSSAIFQPESCS